MSAPWHIVIFVNSLVLNVVRLRAIKERDKPDFKKNWTTFQSWATDKNILDSKKITNKLSIAIHHVTIREVLINSLDVVVRKNRRKSLLPPSPTLYLWLYVKNLWDLIEKRLISSYFLIETYKLWYNHYGCTRCSITYTPSPLRTMSCCPKFSLDREDVGLKLLANLAGMTVGPSLVPPILLAVERFLTYISKFDANIFLFYIEICSMCIQIIIYLLLWKFD